MWCYVMNTNKITELQHEVSSLLEFKNALLETFPHLQRKISVSRPDLSTVGRSRNAEVAPEAASSWSGLGSSATLPRKKMRKLPPEGNSAVGNIVDSGFSTETKDTSSTLLSPSASNNLRWDMWAAHGGHATAHGGHGTADGLAGGDLLYAQPDDDELMYLLDVIERKAARIQREADFQRYSDEDPKRLSRAPSAARHAPLGAISEDDDDQTRRLKRERNILFQRCSDLEAEVMRLAGQKQALEAKLGRDSKGLSSTEEGSAGIHHLVQIRTGGEDRTRTDLRFPDSRDPSDGPARSASDPIRRAISQTELGARSMGGGVERVNIEIKHRSSRHAPSASKVPPTVVNFRSSVPDNLPQKSSSFSDIRKDRKHSFGGRITAPPSVLHARSPQLNRVLSNQSLNPKSKSVEDLLDIPSGHLGLKTANSEMNVSSPHAPKQQARGRLRGTVSEMSINQLKTSEKINVLDGIASMPAELTRGLNRVVKPNREKIRQILNTTNTLELQRQLLTTVMENEVYKTQLERISDQWSTRIGDMEQINATLQSSLNSLQLKNEELKMKMKERTIELESARSRLKLLEGQSSESPAEKSSGQRSSEQKSSAEKPREARVHFDVNNMPKNKRGLSPTKPPQSKPHSQLPPDTRRRLEEMAKTAPPRRVSQPQIASKIPVHTLNNNHGSDNGAKQNSMTLVTQRHQRRESLSSPTGRERSLNLRNSSSSETALNSTDIDPHKKLDMGQLPSKSKPWAEIQQQLREFSARETLKNEPEFTEISLTESSRLFTKRNSWEANNGLEEMTHGSHVIDSPVDSLNEDVVLNSVHLDSAHHDSLHKHESIHDDSLQKNESIHDDSLQKQDSLHKLQDSLQNDSLILQPDSLLAPKCTSSEFFDSISSISTNKKTKKVIIPFMNDSFSSSYDTSSDSSPVDTDGGNVGGGKVGRKSEDESTTPCSTTEDELTMVSQVSVKQKQKQFQQMKHQPMHQQQFQQYDHRGPFLPKWTPLYQGQYPGPYVQQFPEPPPAPTIPRATDTQQSLARIAKESFRRKFLGWN